MAVRHNLSIILLAATLGCAQRSSLEATLHWESEPYFVGVAVVDSADSTGLILIGNDYCIQPVNRRLQTTTGTWFYERGTFASGDIAGATDPEHIWATCRRRDSLFVLDLSQRRELYVTRGVDKKPPTGWDGAITEVAVRDINKDGRTEAVVAVRSGFDTGGRGVYVLDWESGKLLWRVRIGPVPTQILLRDIEGDGQTEILIGTHAVGNGDSAGGTDDARTYVIMLDASGRTRWIQPIGQYASTLSLSWLSDSASPYPPIFAAELGSPAGDRVCDSVFVLDSRDGSVTTRAQHGTYNVMQTVLLGARGTVDVLLGGVDDTLRRLDGASLALRGKTAMRGGISQATLGCNTVSEGLAVVPTKDGKLLVVAPSLRVLCEIQSGQVQAIYPISRTPVPWFLATGRSGDRTPWRLYSLAPMTLLRKPMSVGATLTVLMLTFAVFGIVLAVVRYRQTRDMRVVIRGLTGQAGVVEMDRRGRLLRANPKGRELLRLAEATEKSPLSGRLTPLRFIGRPGVEPRELPLSLPTGQTVLARLTPVKSGLLLTLEDISAVEYMKRITSWAPAAQKLAHDIKNPLTAMALTLQRLDKHRTPETDRYYSSMSDEIGRLKKMADGFMRLSKLEPPKLVPGSINDSVNACLTKFENVKPTGINIVCELAENLPSVALDAEQLAVACTNIVENAISAMSDSGVLTVRSSVADSGERIAVSVQDTGKGIPERYLDKVFEPFFTLKPGGTGLGMALTKRIIEDHKGTIAIQSKEGGGTTVTITLPITQGNGH